MITWEVCKVKLSTLKDYAHNPRYISQGALKQLCRSLQEDGYHQRFLVNRDLMLIGDHQRKKALLRTGFLKDTEVEC